MLIIRARLQRRAVFMLGRLKAGQSVTKWRRRWSVASFVVNGATPQRCVRLSASPPQHFAALHRKRAMADNEARRNPRLRLACARCQRRKIRVSVDTSPSH